MDSIALCLSVSHVLSPHSHAQININLSYNKTRKERKQELISFQFLCDVRIFKQLALLAGCMHCVESFYFLFMRKKHTDWNNLLFFVPSGDGSVPWELRTVFFLFFFLDQDLCTKRDLRIKDLQRTQQNEILTNPNLSAKVHEEAKQRGGMTCTNIYKKQTQKRKVI